MDKGPEDEDSFASKIVEGIVKLAQVAVVFGLG